MTKLAQTLGLTEFQTEIIATVRQFVDKESFPTRGTRTRRHLPAGHRRPDAGNGPVRTDDSAGVRRAGRVAAHLRAVRRGTGARLDERVRVLNTHFIVAYMLRQHGTTRRSNDSCPGWRPARPAARFRCRSQNSVPTSPRSDPGPRNPDGNYTIDGQKMWLTNGATSTLVAVLVRTDEGADKPHRNLTAFLVEKPTGFGEVVPGLLIPGKIDKLGYKGIDTTELIFDGYEASADDILGGTRGRASSR